jgi:hypothetical protein
MFGKADLGTEVFENRTPGYGVQLQRKRKIYEM